MRAFLDISPLKGEKQGVMIQETSSITEILIKY